VFDDGRKRHIPHPTADQHQRGSGDEREPIVGDTAHHVPNRDERQKYDEVPFEPNRAGDARCDEPTDDEGDGRKRAENCPSV